MKLINIYFDVSMSNGHRALFEMAGDEGKRGYCVFINRAWSALKMTTPSNVVLHYKSKDARKPINFHAIKYLPGCVSGGELEYKKALELAVNEQWKKWERGR